VVTPRDHRCGLHITVGSLRFLVLRYDRFHHVYALQNITTIPFRTGEQHESRLSRSDFEAGLEDGTIRLLKRKTHHDYHHDQN